MHVITINSSRICRIGIQNKIINTSMKGSNIILIADMIEEKLRKEKELEFYEAELKKLLLRMSMVRQEISVTETIINMIQNDEIPNLLANLEKYELDLD